MAAIHKCGSTSLRNSAAFCDFRPHKDDLPPLRIAFLRHPIQRLFSAYRGFFYRNATENWRWGLTEHELSDWKRFVDHTLSHANEHWAPQISLLSHDGTYMPTITHRFENLPHLFPRYIPSAKLPHMNKSRLIEVPAPHRLRELEEKYRDDLDLWESLSE